jgi:coenzyme F420-0:L-glutamate ligase/coenzyme F420-1:gamma-L-glutamate ligase
MNQVVATPLKLKLVRPGDDLGALVADAVRALGTAPAPHDVVIVAQKVVSKAEGRYVRLADVTCTEEATELAGKLNKDPALVSLILRESRHVVRAERQALIVQHRLGYVMANAGIDQSNLDPDDAATGAAVLLLPADPDQSAARLRAGLNTHLGVAPAVIVSDSFGRPWRRGSVGVALGVAGMPALIDLRGQPDLFGRPLQVTLAAFADQVASMACLLMGEGAAGIPAVLVQGLSWTAPDGAGQDLIRPSQEDLFLVQIRKENV